MKKPPRLVIALVACLATPVLGAENTATSDLVTRFWNAETETERQSVTAQMLESGISADALYRALQQGPGYSGEVQRGRLDLVREAPDGTRYPYVLLVPDSYDPARSYPVEFMLHGGVSRPLPEESGSWWRRGVDTLHSEDKIVVVPAAWSDAFWWFPNQAENLAAILRETKRRYNVVDNQVSLTGISDGGTGAYFFAFKQPTEWAAFLPFIGHPGVLRNPAGQASYQLYFENLLGKPLYIVNGELDPLYPASSVEPFVDVLREANIPHIFKAIEGGGHNTDWLPAEADAIEQFKLTSLRDPLPDTLQWVADSTDRFNRNHWLIIDQFSQAGRPGMVRVARDGNILNVSTVNVELFTLLLSPEEIDFSRPVAIYLNDSLVRSERLDQDPRTLLKWAGNDLDKSMLFTVELQLRTGG